MSTSGSVAAYCCKLIIERNTGWTECTSIALSANVDQQLCYILILGSERKRETECALELLFERPLSPTFRSQDYQDLHTGHSRTTRLIFDLKLSLTVINRHAFIKMSFDAIGLAGTVITLISVRIRYHIHLRKTVYAEM